MWSYWREVRNFSSQYDYYISLAQAHTTTGS
jgi:hypothetical protein